jgi:hypothetical protein
MPIDEYVAWDLLAWHDFTPYKKSSDYVWAIDASVPSQPILYNGAPCRG